MTNANITLEVFRRLFYVYGRQHWWPAQSAFEMMIGAILTQSTSWTNAAKAILNLSSAGALNLDVLNSLSTHDISRLIYSSGYHNTKAKRIKSLTSFLSHRFDSQIESMSTTETKTLREEFLSVHGIGEETADAILLYALDRPTFVIDLYTRRIFSRLGAVKVGESYGAIQDIFLGNLPPDIAVYQDYHALIIRHGQETCKKTPNCVGCCLQDVCATGKRMDQTYRKSCISQRISNS